MALINIIIIILGWFFFLFCCFRFHYYMLIFTRFMPSSSSSPVAAGPLSAHRRRLAVSPQRCSAAPRGEGTGGSAGYRDSPLTH